jgi:urea carboxylase
MDMLAFRMANQIVGNQSTATGLEIAVSGPTLKFDTDTIIALTGANMNATLDGTVVPLWTPVEAKAGSTLAMGPVQGAGARAYLAIQGGFDVPRVSWQPEHVHPR